MKYKSFSLFEVLLSICILSIVIIYSISFFKQNILFYKKNFNLEIQKLDILSFKVFISKQLENKKIIAVSSNKLILDEKSIFLKNSTLYYNDSILLKNITSFKIQKSKLLKINICNKTICDEMIFIL